MLTAALTLAGFLAGLTGTWSPCGFSMVDSLGRGSREGRPAVTLASCAAFGVGALGGAAALYGALAAVGSLLGAHGGHPAAVGAFAVAAAAALAELRGVRIRPQIRRQVPEPWRRAMPLPLAGALYGVLLGLGFTTFVFTLSVVALAAISLALGDIGLGLAVGVAFGAGRALPVVALAPAVRTAWGGRAMELMAERPLVLRGFRAADGLALAAAAVALGTGPAWGSRQVASPASDPSVSDGLIAFDDGRGGVLVGGGHEARLPGGDPALGSHYVAWLGANRIVVFDRSAGRVQVTLAVRGVNAVAVSRRWVAWRARTRRGERISAARLPSGRGGRRIRSIRGPGRLGAPDLDGNRLAYSVAGHRGSKIAVVNLRTHRRRTAARSRIRQLLSPSLRGSRLLYVAIGRCGQQLRLHRGRRTRVLLRGRPLGRTDAGFDRGHTPQGSGTGRCPRRFRITRTMLWTTALGRRYAYVTLLRPASGRGVARIVRVRR
ncbi:MAG TPA: hypothetical protein VGF21_09035 [Thermoleophilaceae bacterium]